MTYLVCMLEEPSAEEMLKVVLSEILPQTVHVIYMVFEGKQDLEKRLETRLREWQLPNTYFLVMRDQDSGDCVSIKTELAKRVSQSGKSGQTLIRIACRELESFYLGDLQAVERGLNLNHVARQQDKQKYRHPDQIANASVDLAGLTNNLYQKVQGSRLIARHLRLDGSNTSHSFNVLISGIQKLIFSQT